MFAMQNPAWQPIAQASGCTSRLVSAGVASNPWSAGTTSPDRVTRSSTLRRRTLRTQVRIHFCWDRRPSPSNSQSRTSGWILRRSQKLANSSIGSILRHFELGLGEHIELIREADHLRAVEVTKGVGGQTESAMFLQRRAVPELTPRSPCSKSGQNQVAGVNEIATGDSTPRHAAPSLSRTRAPTSSSLPSRPEFVRFSCRDATPV